MNYEEYVSNLISQLSNDFSVERVYFKQNDGCVQDSMTVKGKNGEHIIYLSLGNLYDVSANPEEVRKSLAIVLANQSLSFDEASSKFGVKLVNYEANADFLQNVVCRTIFDLALVPYILIESSFNRMISFAITNRLADGWGKSPEDIIDLAIANSSRISGVVFLSMREKFKVHGFDAPELDEVDGFYVLSNTTGVNGASTIFYPGILEIIHTKLDQDFYVLPCSIHEVLILKANPMISTQDLHQIVMDVNRENLTMKERLSDSVYFFDGELHWATELPFQ